MRCLAAQGCDISNKILMCLKMTKSGFYAYSNFVENVPYIPRFPSQLWSFLPPSFNRTACFHIIRCWEIIFVEDRFTSLIRTWCFKLLARIFIQSNFDPFSWMMLVWNSRCKISYLELITNTKFIIEYNGDEIKLWHLNFNTVNLSSGIHSLFAQGTFLI